MSVTADAHWNTSRATLAAKLVGGNVAWASWVPELDVLEYGVSTTLALEDEPLFIMSCPPLNARGAAVGASVIVQSLARLVSTCVWAPVMSEYSQ